MLLWRGSHCRASAQNLVDRYTPHVIPRVTVDQIFTWSSVDDGISDAAAAIVHAGTFFRPEIRSTCFLKNQVNPFLAPTF